LRAVGCESVEVRAEEQVEGRAEEQGTAWAGVFYLMAALLLAMAAAQAM